MFRFEKLEVWQLAISYGKDCYEIASKFPSYEKFGVGDQLRRATLSISNNIAEGSVGSSLQFRKYITIAIASTLETVNILRFVYEINYIGAHTKDEMYEKAERLIRKLTNFSKSLEKH